MTALGNQQIRLSRRLDLHTNSSRPCHRELQTVAVSSVQIPVSTIEVSQRSCSSTVVAVVVKSAGTPRQIYQATAWSA